MSIYRNFITVFKNAASDEAKYSFEEIEEKLGFTLPDSSKKSHFWKNDLTKPQASKGWLKYGWKVKSVDIENQLVVFHRIKGNHIPQENREISAAAEFEYEVAKRMSKKYNKNLYAGNIPGHPKMFDMVSDDKEIVGEAKYFSTSGDKLISPAKLSMISEQVWFLEKVKAKIRFIVFGDKSVPEAWLKKYGKLSKGVVFYFYDTNTGDLEKFNNKRGKN